MSQNKYLYRVWLESEGREHAAEVRLPQIDPQWAVIDTLNSMYNERDGEFAKEFPTTACVEGPDGSVSKYKVHLDFEPIFDAEEVTE